MPIKRQRIDKVGKKEESTEFGVRVCVCVCVDVWMWWQWEE